MAKKAKDKRDTVRRTLIKLDPGRDRLTDEQMVAFLESLGLRSPGEVLPEEEQKNGGD